MGERRQTAAEGFFAAVLAEAGRLGLGWWERIVLTLAAATIVVAVRIGGPAVLAALKKVAYEPADNAPGSDGSAPGDVHDSPPPPEMGDPSESHRPPESESGSGG